MGSSKNEVIFDVPVKTIYGKQHFVRTKKYEDHPTENQILSREAFAELKRRVASEIHDPIKGIL